MNKICFRYLFVELLKPFFFCLIACVTLWIVADLFGTLDDFIQQKAPWSLIIDYYWVLSPRILILVLPMAVLFASLYTLLTFSKRQELVAMQAAGLSWIQIYFPFLFLGGICALILFYLVTGPVTRAESESARIMDQVRNKGVKPAPAKGLVYFDPQQYRIWYIQTLNPETGRAEGVEILQRNASGQDEEKYFAKSAQWNGRFWTLIDVKKLIFSANGDVANTTLLPNFEWPILSTKPRDLTLLQAKANELSYNQLHQFISSTKNKSPHHLAPYQTQIYYQLAYPFTPFVLLLFAMAFCGHDTRRSPAAGVFNAIFVLLSYWLLMNFFLGMGRGDRLAPFIAGWGTPLLFSAVGLYLLEQRIHWTTSMRLLLDSR